MKKIWVNKVSLFSQADTFDVDYYLKMPKRERLETMQFLREIYYKINPKVKHAHREGLRRTIRVIQ